MVELGSSGFFDARKMLDAVLDKAKELNTNTIGFYSQTMASRSASNVGMAASVGH